MREWANKYASILNVQKTYTATRMTTTQSSYATIMPRRKANCIVTLSSASVCDRSDFIFSFLSLPEIVGSVCFSSCWEPHKVRLSQMYTMTVEYYHSQIFAKVHIHKYIPYGAYT